MNSPIQWAARGHRVQLSAPPRPLQPRAGRGAYGQLAGTPHSARADWQARTRP